ncbi:hypothetical protein KFE25_008588 [Diacronema lutheri]|uniref:WD repeat-containing protein on Y chromosome n=1 Tax=Diacronema lutheri TaxID=2081491 RepID=A0A8J6CCR9_DIALT|nr:hypothetical protein KFE25_008588 [Diacronema lutheri]
MPTIAGGRAARESVHASGALTARRAEPANRDAKPPRPPAHAALTPRTDAGGERRVGRMLVQPSRTACRPTMRDPAVHGLHSWAGILFADADADAQQYAGAARARDLAARARAAAARGVRSEPLDDLLPVLLGVIDAELLESLRARFAAATDQLPRGAFCRLLSDALSSRMPYGMLCEQGMHDERLLGALLEMHGRIDTAGRGYVEWSQFTDFLAAHLLPPSAHGGASGAGGGGDGGIGGRRGRGDGTASSAEIYAAARVVRLPSSTKEQAVERVFALPGLGLLLLAEAPVAYNRLIDAHTGRRRATLDGARSETLTAERVPPLSLLITCHADRSLCAWSEHDWRLVARAAMPCAQLCAAWVPAIARLVTGAASAPSAGSGVDGADGLSGNEQPFYLYVWDVVTLALDGPPLRGHTAAVSALARVGRELLTSASLDGTVRIWHLGQRVCLKVLRGEHARGIVAMAYAPVERGTLITVGVDGGMCAWSLHGSLPIFRAARAHGHEAPLVCAHALGGTPYVIIADQAARVSVWDCRSHACVQLFDVAAPAALLADTASGARARAGGVAPPARRLLAALAPVGERGAFAAVTCTRALVLCEQTSTAARAAASAEHAAASGEPAPSRRATHSPAVCHAAGGVVAVLHDARAGVLVTVGSRDVAVWDCATGVGTRRFENAARAARALGARGGALGASDLDADDDDGGGGGEDGARAAGAWDVQITAAALDARGRRLALGLDSGELLVLDIASGELLIRWPAHDGDVSYVGWGAEPAQQLVSASWDGTVRARRTTAESADAPALARGLLVGELRRAHGEVTCAALGPGARLLAAGCERGAVVVFALDPFTARQRATLVGEHAAAVLALAFCTPWPLLASADAKGRVVVWTCATAHARARFRPACRLENAFAPQPASSVGSLSYEHVRAAYDDAARAGELSAPMPAYMRAEPSAAPPPLVQPPPPPNPFSARLDADDASEPHARTATGCPAHTHAPMRTAPLATAPAADSAHEPRELFGAPHARGLAPALDARGPAPALDAVVALGFSAEAATLIVADDGGWLSAWRCDGLLAQLAALEALEGVAHSSLAETDAPAVSPRSGESGAGAASAAVRHDATRRAAPIGAAAADAGDEGAAVAPAARTLDERLGARAREDSGGEDSGGEDSGGEDSGGEDSGGEDSGGEDSGGELFVLTATRHALETDAADGAGPETAARAVCALAHLEQPTCVARWRAHSRALSSVLVMRSPVAVVSASTDGTVATWTVHGALLGYLDPARTPHDDSALARSPSPPPSPVRAALREAMRDAPSDAPAQLVRDWHLPAQPRASERAQLDEARALLELQAEDERAEQEAEHQARAARHAATHAHALGAARRAA